MKGVWLLTLLSAAVVIPGVRGSGELCHMPLDVFFIQDTTGSFQHDLTNIKEQIPTLIQEIEKNFPDTRFGFGEHRDKPYKDLGELSDYCYKMRAPIGTPVDELQTIIGSLHASAGGDTPEAQFHAIIDAVNDPFIGWRDLLTKKNDSTAASPGARLIVISTDAKPHDPGDYELYPDQAPNYMEKFPDNYAGFSAERLCSWYDYPSQWQVRDELQRTSTFLGILTPPIGKDVDEAVHRRWHEINEKILGQPPGFYQIIQRGSTDFIEGLIKVLRSITTYACEVQKGGYATGAAELPLSGFSETQAAPPDATDIGETAPISKTDDDDDAGKGCCDEGFGLVIKLNDENAKKLVVNYVRDTDGDTEEDATTA